MAYSWIILAGLVASVAAERISKSPWDSSSSGASDRSGNNDDSRFPITGSRFSGSGSDVGTRFTDRNSNSDSLGSRGSSSSRDSDSLGSRGSLNSGSRGSGSFSGSGSGSSSSRGDNNYVRIDAAIVKLSNNAGKVSSGSSCSTFGKCDPLVYANLDTERPNANWPGATDVKFWPLLLSAKGTNDLNVGITNITKRYCGQRYSEANLRVRVEDKKMLTSNGVINEFDCPINRDPAPSAMSATWSPEAQCIPRFPKGGQQLSYKYKVYFIDRLDCDMAATAPTTTKKSFFGK